MNGYSTTCGSSNSAGLQEIKLVDVSEVSSVTFTGEAISAVTLTMSSTWESYDFEQDTAGWSETKVEGKKAIWNLSVEWMMRRMDESQRLAVEEMADCNCGIIAAVYDNNGIIWLVGGNLTDGGAPTQAHALYLSGNEGGSGKDLEGDENEQSVVLAGKQPSKSRTYSGTWASLATS